MRSVVPVPVRLAVAFEGVPLHEIMALVGIFGEFQSVKICAFFGH